LGQVATSEKSNEITAIPELLERLELHGAIVTIDAMGCQKAIASKIIERGGNYVLVVKDNQPTLHEEVAKTIRKTLTSDLDDVQQDQHSTEDRGHGRVERRHCTILLDPKNLTAQNEWEGLRVVGMYVRERQVGDAKPTIETTYFIGNKVMSAKNYLKVLRDHWGIENNLHWQLDVTFAEDDNRVSKRHGAENLALLRKLALMMLKRHPSKQSLACKQLNAALNPQFLEETLIANANADKI
jgi:predicted transposase YbfD/YdcC